MRVHRTAVRADNRRLPGPAQVPARDVSEGGARVAAWRAGQSVKRHHPLANRCVLALLRSPLHRLLDPGLRELRYRGRRTGKRFALPVMYAQAGDRFVVLVGDPEGKSWWRNFAAPAPVEVRRGHKVRTGLGRIVRPGDDGYADAAATYTQRHRLVPLPSERLLVIDAA